MARVRKVAFPPESRLHPDLPAAYFHDAWEAPLADPSLTPVELAQRALAATPGWVEAMLRLRNTLVKPFGVQPATRLGERRSRPDRRWAPGDRLSIFRICSIDDTELVMGIDDAHLDVRISFLVRRAGPASTWVVSSWVKTHNRFGQVYMWPVAPFHALIVIGMMRALSPAAGAAPAR
jgi:hypothetical protein